MTQDRAERTQQAFHDQLAVLWRHKWLVVNVTLLAGGLAAVLSFLQTPSYTATAQVVSSPPEVSGIFNSASVRAYGTEPERRLATQVELFKSTEVGQGAAELLGGDDSDAESLLRVVKVAPVGQTDVIEVSASHSDPKRAAAIANAFAEAFTKFQADRALSTITNLTNQIETRLKEAKTTLDTVDDEFQEALGSKTPGAAQSLTVRRDAALQEYTQLKERYDDLQVQASLQQESTIVSEKAEPPLSPSAPRPLRNTALALLLGLAAGVGLAFLRDRMDDKIRTRDDLEKVASAPVLAVVPDFGGKRRSKRSPAPLAATGDSAAGEAFRRLRTNLRFLDVDTPVRVIGVTSARPGDGKSTVALNLSACLAESGVDVMLVGCDLRKPVLHHVYKEANDTGLTTVLTQKTPIESAIKVVKVGHGKHQMLFLPSGPVPPNPSELLGSAAMFSLIERWREESGVIVLDLPPLMPIADTAVIAPYLDGVLLVARADVTRTSELEHATEAMNRVRARVLGVVLNGVKGRGGSRYEYYYGYESTPPPLGPAPLQTNGKPVPLRRPAAAVEPDEAPTVDEPIVLDDPIVLDEPKAVGVPNGFVQSGGGRGVREAPRPHRLR